VNTKYDIYDLQLRVEALELLLISRDDTNEENLKIFRSIAKDNHTRKGEEFRKEQWSKVTLGSVIQYDVYPSGSSLVIEIISISPQPFMYLAGKITKKKGRSSYRVGELFTATNLSRFQLAGYTNEIISRE